MLILKIPFCPKQTGEELAPDIIAGILNKNPSNCCNLKYYEVPVKNKDAEEDLQAIFTKVGAFESNAIAIGGIHELTYPCFKAFTAKYPDAGLIYFDAHPDLLKNDHLKKLVEEKTINPLKIIILGARNLQQNEIDFIKQNKINLITAKHIFDYGVKDVCDGVMERARNWPGLYISIDIDVVDPAFAPATLFPEPGGLSSRELLYFISRLKNLKNLKFMDIAEINPKKDINEITSKLAASIITECISAKDL